MKVLLMNKDNKILAAEYDNATASFTSLYNVYNIDYVPYILKNIYIEDEINSDLFRTNLTNWFKGRGIPSWRDKLDLLLYRLNISTPIELLDKSFALSLSDQY